MTHPFDQEPNTGFPCNPKAAAEKKTSASPLDSTDPEDTCARIPPVPVAVDPEMTGYGDTPEISPGPVDADNTRYTPTAAPLSSKRRFQPCAFGPYDLLEEIAQGGFGVVYKARQRGHRPRRGTQAHAQSVGRLAGNGRALPA